MADNVFGGCYFSLYYSIFLTIVPRVVERCLPGADRVLTAASYIVVVAVVASTPTVSSSSPQPERWLVLITSLYFSLTQPALKAEEVVTSLVSSCQSDVFQQLEHLYIPLFIRLVCILSSTALCLSTLLMDPSVVAVLGCYTNISLPLSRLSAEILNPLKQEIEGLQAFREPTKAELSEGGQQCPVCLDVMLVARITPCGHIFHSHCLRKCLSISNSCPYCRAPLVSTSK